jgi:hypothetical protein
MIRALTLAILFAQAITAYSAINLDSYPTPSEIAAESLEDDFSDSAVGCLDDCLEPFTDPATVPEEYAIRAEE